MKRIGERLASDSDQTDVYVCPAKERAGNPSRPKNKSLADELAELRGLDLTALKLRWHALYRTEAPIRIGQALLLQAVAYSSNVAIRRRQNPSTTDQLSLSVELLD